MASCPLDGSTSFKIFEFFCISGWTALMRKCFTTLNELAHCSLHLDFFPSHMETSSQHSMHSFENVFSCTRDAMRWLLLIFRFFVARELFGNCFGRCLGQQLWQYISFTGSGFINRNFCASNTISIHMRQKSEQNCTPYVSKATVNLLSTLVLD